MVFDAEASHARRQTVAIGLALLLYQLRMGSAKNDIDDVGAGFDDLRHGIEHCLNALVRGQQTEGQNDHLSGEVESGLGVMRFEEWEIRNSVRYDLNLAVWHIMNSTEEFVASFRHDDDSCRNVDDPTHYMVLDGRRFGEHRVQFCDNRHFKPRQKFDDVAAGLTAENHIFVLK